MKFKVLMVCGVCLFGLAFSEPKMESLNQEAQKQQAKVYQKSSPYHFCLKTKNIYGLATYEMWEEDVCTGTLNERFIEEGDTYYAELSDRSGVCATTELRVDDNNETVLNILGENQEKIGFILLFDDGDVFLYNQEGTLIATADLILERDRVDLFSPDSKNLLIARIKKARDLTNGQKYHTVDVYEPANIDDRLLKIFAGCATFWLKD